MIDEKAMSDERLAELRGRALRYFYAGYTAQKDVQDAVAEIDRLRAALDFAESVAADRLSEDKKYLDGWKDARDKAAEVAEKVPVWSTMYRAPCDDGKEIAETIRGMQP